MGLESSTIVHRVLQNPDAYNVDLDRLVILSAQTGLESEHTKIAMEEILYPEIRRKQVLTVQIGRAGPKVKDGYVILDSTRNPTVCHIKGGPWTLAHELEQNGTLPQIANGRRICSSRHKGEVLDAYISDKYPRTAFQHFIGFNVEEPDRVTKDLSYASKNPYRTVRHPLVDEKWGRVECDAYWMAVAGTTIKKSACSICPFSCSSGGIATMLERYRTYPHQAGYTLWLEHIALALNPNMALFGKKTAYSVLRADNNLAALADYEQRLNATRWAIYDVRRILPKPPARPMRSVKQVWSGTRENAPAALQEYATRRGLVVEQSDRHERAYQRRRQDLTTYPYVESFLTIGPATVVDKQRPSFEDTWRSAVDLDSRIYQQESFV